MMNYRTILLLMSALVAAAGGATEVAAAPSPSPATLSFVRSFPHVNRREVVEIARQIESGPRDLAAQRAGLLLRVRALQLADPLPERNAAPVYGRLMRLLRAHPLNPATDAVRGSLGVMVAHEPEDVERLQRLVAERQDVMALVHEAASKPECVFRRDWSRGLLTEFPEFASMREAVRLLRVESYLMAREGRATEAVANLAHGFRIAEHVGATPNVIGYLMGIACEAIALAGMEDILALCGENAKAAEAVQTALATERPRISVRRMLEGEVVVYAVGMATLRRGGRETALRLSREAGLPDPTPRVSLPKFTPAEKRVWNQYLDAGEARFLRIVRQIMAASDKPYLAGKPVLDRLGASGETEARNPIDDLQGPARSLASAASKGLLVRAREEVLMAGAAVLAHKARRGAFPISLQEAMPEPPFDPFGSGPLLYRQEEEGFVIYSIGASGRFDGGRAGARSAAREAYFRYPR